MKTKFLKASETKPHVDTIQILIHRKIAIICSRHRATFDHVSTTKKSPPKPSWRGSCSQVHTSPTRLNDLSI